MTSAATCAECGEPFAYGEKIMSSNVIAGRPHVHEECAGPSAATERSCVKCGSDDIAVSWHAAGADHPTRYYAECRTYGADRGLPKEEHLCCTCRVCQYRWKEDVLDALIA